LFAIRQLKNETLLVTSGASIQKEDGRASKNRAGSLHITRIAGTVD
jgi:hypothetical protein